jgi:hypothetical protein
MINESQCYITVLSVHHNYITIGPTRDTVILKAGEVAMMGLGVGILSHQNIPADQRQMERLSMFKPCVFIF